jgi:DDE superfamily endonuclease/Tc5 transposase DNA-binding domain/helix-turn-helix, Psq domain
MSPPNTTHLVHQEGRITLAIEALNQGRCISVRAAAKLYDVARSTLQDRINKHPARRDSRPASCKLTEIEESTLVQWILSMDERGLPPRPDTVQQMANLLLQKRCQNRTVGQRWVYNFVQRHDALKSRYNRKYDYQRAKCEDPTIIRDWFRLVQNTIEKYGILDEDVYNFDETGFQMGVISTAKVITGAEKAKPVSIQPGNREWVTVIDCISSYGWNIPPVIIFEGKVHQSTWYSETLPSDWVIGVSENGWTDNELGFTWLEHVFEKHTAHRTKGVYRLPILDGHGSHLTPEFDLFCKEHSIITLCMPPHSSHLLQPLDVVCFAVLKQSYGRQIEGYMRNGVNHIDKPDFLHAFHAARTEAMTLANVQSSFAATGLVPHNPERVLSKLHTQLKTPTPPSTSHTNAPANTQAWAFETPHDTAQLVLQANAMKRTALPTPTNRALDQLVKGCQMAMNSAVLLAEENRQLRHENERQKKKRAKKRTFIATGGVLTNQEGIARQQRSQVTNIVPEREVVTVEATVKTRAPRTCSMCKSLLHTARTCPTKQVSN